MLKNILSIFCQYLMETDVKIKKIYGIIIGSVLATFTVVGCGSGTASSTPATNFTQDGPLNHQALAARLAAPPLEDQSRQSLNSTASTTSAVTGIIADVVPAAGIVFGPISVLTGAFGSNAEDAHLQDQIDTINATLVNIQSQINGLESQIVANNALYNNFVQQQTGNNACSALLNWNSVLRNIYAAPANYFSTSTPCGAMANNINSGIGNKFMGYLNGQSVASVALNSAVMQNISTLSIDNTTSFQAYVNSLSTTNIKETSGTSLTLNSSWSPDIYNYIVASKLSTASACTITPNSDATASMLVCGYQYLIGSMLPIPGIQSSNVVDTINDYNQLVFNLYQQDLLALQYAYTIEATSNYMNYVAYSNCLNNGESATMCATSTNQIPSWEGMQAITFSVGSNDPSQISPNTLSTVALAGEYLTAAQQNLVTVYAARINALYKNTLNFTISDNPLSTQSYAPPPASITMSNGNTIKFTEQGNMYSTIQAATLSSTVNGGSIPGGALNDNLGGLFYQYNGINQIWSCLGQSTLQSLTNPNGPVPTINLLNCESAFPNSSTSYYDGVTMSAYGASSVNAGGVIPTNELNTNSYCNQQNPFVLNYPEVWGNQLICNVWAGSQFVNSTAFPGNAAQPPQVGGYIHWPSNYYGEAFSVPGAQYSFVAEGKYPDFFLIASGQSNSPGYVWGEGSGYFNYLSSNPWGIVDEGYPTGKYTSEGQAHEALLQVTLPNNYIFPFYLYTTSINLASAGSNLEIYGSLVCTAAMQGQVGGGSATPPGVSACVQDEEGGITLTTTDGNSYTIQFEFVRNATASNQTGIAVVISN